MGNSVYAQLVYGFPVMDNEGEEEAVNHPPDWLLPDPHADGSEMLDIEDIATRLEGLKPPTSNSKRAQDDFWAAQRAAEKRTGVVLVEHCRQEHQMWILGVAESLHSQSRGEVTRLGRTIEAKPEWRETLKSFCDKAGIPFQEPEWLLAPYSA